MATGKDMDHWQGREIERLRGEVAQIREERRAEIEARHQETLDTRKMPPMAQMTRLQRRYFLEPWMTTITVTSGILAVAGYLLGIFLPLHVEFCMVGLIFTLAGGGALLTKLNLMQWNSKTEGQIRDRRY